MMKQFLNKILPTYKESILFYGHLIIFFFLSLGVHYYSGTKYFPLLALYFLPFLATYLILYTGSRKYLQTFVDKISNRFVLSEPSAGVGFKVMAVSLFGIVIWQMIHLGYIPIIEAFKIHDSVKVAILRQEISSSSGMLWNYVSEMSMKGVIPFFLLLAYLKLKRKYSFLIIAFFAFYSVAMMQKSYVVTVLLPLLIYLLFTKRFLSFTILIGIISVGVISLVYAANPGLRGVDELMVATNPPPPVEVIVPDTLNENVAIVDSIPLVSEPIPEEPIITIEMLLNKWEGFKVTIESILNRVLFVPGRVVHIWFSHIPNDIPFLNGCGYKFMAPFLGCDFVNYDAVIYAIEFPMYSGMGIKGSINCASFVVDYANFGKVGLVVSGIITALFFLLIEMMFGNNYPLKLSFNLYFILILSSSTLTTTMLSGGWGLIIILFILFRNYLFERKVS